MQLYYTTEALIHVLVEPHWIFSYSSDMYLLENTPAQFLTLYMFSVQVRRVCRVCPVRVRRPHRVGMQGPVQRARPRPRPLFPSKHPPPGRRSHHRSRNPHSPRYEFIGWKLNIIRGQGGMVVKRPPRNQKVRGSNPTTATW